ncbi:hypothetical protein Z968_08310 [Clostridium novyi A str. 4552]|uniref:DUF3784 domain-containing protein n=1 Tax=Clostridium novyi A str. 4552 TaxID=1444289 RepID=A0A0A0I5B9_CLONO|nr:hypothetical protein [Clostridium novyi]KGM95778.1 hypothetical protein Z968_08310 [Clostridium novyi A str. 4552]
MNKNFLIRNIEFILIMIVGLVHIICGISAIAFNKYPCKKGALKEIEKEYGTVSEKKLSKFEGTRFIIFGILWIGSAIMHIKKSVILGKIIICSCIIFLILYFTVRHRIFSKK